MLKIGEAVQLERGFSMALGRFCDLRDPDCIITWAECNGEILALLQFVPWNKNGLSLDLMRRSPDAETGVNELMICATLEYARTHEVEQISLNFASFRSIFEKGKKLGAGPITRINHRILIFLSRFFQMESLYRFNAKFRPTWEPRYVVFPGISHLGRVGIAILTIESFIPKANEIFVKRSSQ
jgi:lysyl-tRNA synthetase class 2